MVLQVKGSFSPRDREKYRGVYPIIYRSSWELSFFQYLDTKKEIVWWKSESVQIPYYNPLKKKWCRYFPDIVMGIQREYGIEVRVVEIKPYKYTQPPTLPKSGRKTKSYNYHLEQYITNQSKWKSCEEYCSNRGYNFQILTEEDNSEWKKFKPNPVKSRRKRK